MPAFTFEKISPPQHPHPAESEPKSSQPRGVMVRLLDRFVASRVKSSLREEQAAISAAHRKQG